jgi:hypothetical protein
MTVRYLSKSFVFGENPKYEPVSHNFNKILRLGSFVAEFSEKIGFGILNITFDSPVKKKNVNWISK